MANVLFSMIIIDKKLLINDILDSINVRILFKFTSLGLFWQRERIERFLKK